VYLASSCTMQVAINWCICKGCIPIPGIKTVTMAKDNIGALGWRLTAAEECALDAAALSSKGSMVQNIFQTT
jgi:pyridoxine 4-dehydrogenase